MTESRVRDRESTATEASDWYARLRAENVSELDAAKFRAWLAGDPERRRKFEEIDGMWDDLTAVERSPEVARTRAEIAARRRRAAAPYFRRSWAVAAAVVLAIGAAFFVWQQRIADSYVTAIGEQRTVPLADGSVIVLNTATAIRLHYSPRRRDVELLRGQASFEVAKDKARPFIVAAGGGEVRAVGTIFDIHKTVDKVTVTLIEGKVAILAPQLPDSAAKRSTTLQRQGVGAVMLVAGEQLSYSTGTGTIERSNADLHRATAWRDRKLDFSDTPLPEAIAEANRYSRDQIVLDAPELTSARISGTFEAGKSDLLVEGLQRYFHLNAERASDHQIILTPAQATDRQ